MLTFQSGWGCLQSSNDFLAICPPSDIGIGGKGAGCGFSEGDADFSELKIWVGRAVSDVLHEEGDNIVVLLLLLVVMMVMLLFIGVHGSGGRGAIVGICTGWPGRLTGRTVIVSVVMRGRLGVALGTLWMGHAGCLRVDIGTFGGGDGGGGDGGEGTWFVDGPSALGGTKEGNGRGG